MSNFIQLPSGARFQPLTPRTFPSAIPLPPPPGVCAQCGRVAAWQTFCGVWLCAEHARDMRVRRGLVGR